MTDLLGGIDFSVQFVVELKRERERERERENF